MVAANYNGSAPRHQTGLLAYNFVRTGAAGLVYSGFAGRGGVGAGGGGIDKAPGNFRHYRL